MTEVDPENVTSVGDEPTEVVTMPVTCPVPGCGVEIDAEGDTCGAVKAALLNIHFETVHKAAQKSRPLPLPKLAACGSAEQLEDLPKDGEGWCKASSVDDGNKTAYLLNCCEDSLRRPTQKCWRNQMQMSSRARDNASARGAETGEELAPGRTARPTSTGASWPE